MKQLFIGTAIASDVLSESLALGTEQAVTSSSWTAVDGARAGTRTPGSAKRRGAGAGGLPSPAGSPEPSGRGCFTGPGRDEGALASGQEGRNRVAVFRPRPRLLARIGRQRIAYRLFDCFLDNWTGPWRFRWVAAAGKTRWPTGERREKERLRATDIA
jgi:hypothetical protein